MFLKHVNLNTTYLWKYLKPKKNMNSLFYNIQVDYSMDTEVIVWNGSFILLHSLIVKNCPDISGWHRSICLDKLEVGELLCDLTIFVDKHKLHLNRKLKPLFFPLSDSNRWKNSEKWSNLCLNLASCSSSAIILLQKNVFSNSYLSDIINFLYE